MVLLYILCAHVMERSLHPDFIVCAYIIYSRTLSSLEDNLRWPVGAETCSFSSYSH